MHYYHIIQHSIKEFVNVVRQEKEIRSINRIRGSNKIADMVVIVG